MSWASGAGARRPQPSTTGGGVKPLRAYRRHPYPAREERKDAHSESENYENLEHQDDYSGKMNYETYDHSAPRSHTAHQPSAGEGKHSALYQRLYEQFRGDGAKQPADCVVLSVNNQNLDYPKSLGHCLQERGLSVEMLFLQAESGLTRALQDVRSDGSPLCILVEQTNVTLSSCTVIIFSESLKIHRNMPKDQAMEFVMAEFGRLSSGRRKHDTAEAAARAAELTDEYIERAKLELHFVPSSMRHLLFLMTAGLHLYPEELGSIAQYIQNRQDHLRVSPSELDSRVASETTNSLPAGLGNPPPLVPTPVTSRQPASDHSVPASGMGEPPQGHNLGVPDPYQNTKPPPLLSLDVLQGCPHKPPAPHSPSAPRSSPVPHGPPGPHLNPAPHGPPAPHLNPAPQGPPASHSHPAPHGHPALHGASYGTPSSFNPQPSRGPPAPRGPPGLRSPLGPREASAPRAPYSRQSPPGPNGPPVIHGLADHGPCDFHPSRGPLLHRGPPPSHRPILLRGPPSQNGPRGPPPLRGPRVPPPALRSLHMGNPAGPAPRPLRHLLPWPSQSDG